MFTQLLKHTQSLISRTPIYRSKNKGTIPTIIIGLSGGPDSVFLLHLLKALYDTQKIKLIAAHLDHGWRDKSQEDMLFCRSLCTKLGIKLEAVHAQDLNLTIAKHSSQESHGRALRRYYFKNLAEKFSAKFIALGHHANDQQETFIMRLMRGSSLDGLTCMKDIDGLYLRPLLHTPRSTIINYLHSHDISYLKDPSNNSLDFLRNRIRHTVVPALTTCDNRFEDKFASTLTHLQEANQLLHDLTQASFTHVFTDKAPHVGSLKKFQLLSKPLQKRVILHWLCLENAAFTPSNGLLSEIIRFLNAPRGGTHQIDKSWTIWKKQDLFKLDKLSL